MIVFERSHLSRAHTGRQEHGAGARPDADRVSTGVAAAEGEGEVAGHDEPPAPEQEAGGGEGEDEVRAGRKTGERISKDSGAGDQQTSCRTPQAAGFWSTCNAWTLLSSQPWRSG